MHFKYVLANSYKSMGLIKNASSLRMTVTTVQSSSCGVVI